MPHSVRTRWPRRRASSAAPAAPPPDINGGLDVYEGFAEVDRADRLAIVHSSRNCSSKAVSAGRTTRSPHRLAELQYHDLEAGGQLGSGPRHQVPRQLPACRPCAEHLRAVHAADDGLTNLAIDPCARRCAVANANLRAICLAQGAPAASIGTIANPTAGQANITTGGNLALAPEKANTWTVGAVIRPSFMTGFSATLDYYHIKVTDAITLPTPGDMITLLLRRDSDEPAGQCGTSGLYAHPAQPDHRQLDGSPADTPGLFGALSNQGKITTDGIDLTFDYRHGLGTILDAPAKIALNFGGNYTHSQKFQATPSLA